MERNNFLVKQIETGQIVYVTSSKSDAESWIKNLIRISQDKDASEKFFKITQEQLIYPPTVFNGDGTKKEYESYKETLQNRKVGDRLCH